MKFPPVFALVCVCAMSGASVERNTSTRCICTYDQLMWTNSVNEKLLNSYYVLSMMLGPGEGEELKTNKTHSLPLRRSPSFKCLTHKDMWEGIK